MGRDVYHHGDLRRALLEAAEGLVARQGAAQVSLRSIAREAGVSSAAPYHHFPDRESLLAEVASSGFRHLGAAMERAAEARPDGAGLDRLRAAGIAYVGFAVANPHVYRLMFSGLLSDRSRFPGLQAAADATFGVLLRHLGSHEPGGPDGSLPAVALATWSTVHGLASLLIEGMLRDEATELGIEEITRRVTLVLGRGLKAFQGEDADGR